MPIYKMAGKKDGKQKYRVRINYQDSMGKPRQIDRVAFGSDEAKALERELEQSIKQTPPSSRMTVQELADEYLAAKKYEVRESTHDKAKQLLEHHILPEMGDTKLDKLTTPVLQAWKLSIEKKPLAVTSKRNAYKAFRALLNYGVKMDHIPKNPLVKLGTFKSPMEAKKEMDYYTAEEFTKFIQAARKCALRAERAGDWTDWHYYVFFALAFYTGLRKGEINGLQWDDIQNGFLSVRRSITQKLKGEDRVTPPKNQTSIRTLQLPAQLIKILDEHKRRCRNVEGFTEQHKICGGDKALRDSTIQHRNARYAEMAGVKTIRIHDFRHPYVKHKTKKYERLLRAEIVRELIGYFNAIIRVDGHFFNQRVSQGLGQAGFP